MTCYTLALDDPSFFPNSNKQNNDHHVYHLVPFFWGVVQCGAPKIAKLPYKWFDYGL
jgi:hypothetical protein